MLSKNEVKYIQSLCHKKQRDEQQLFIGEGPKLTEELLKSDFEIVNIYAVEDWAKANISMAAKVTIISQVELERITTLQTPNKVVIIARQKQLTTLPNLSGQLALVLDGIQDPGNMGTIVRIADWFGVKHLIASTDTVEIYNSKVVQATMGSICRVNVYYSELDSFIESNKTPTYGALLDGKSLYEMGTLKEGLIVIGSEGKGIRPAIVSKITHPVTIPKIGGAESLNAAVATGIILSHLVGNNK
jgi:TrmH family RNA methyltransferase